MSITIEWANSNKRRNSTKQFQPGTDSHITVTLKENTSVDHPTFIISAPWIGWNVCKWGDRYYFVDDIISIGNNLWEVSCVMDVLATFKDDILASTQFVSYSSENSSNWLPDTRIPSTLKVTTHGSTGQSLSFLDMSSGAYILNVVGKDSARSYITNQSGVNLIAKELTNWRKSAYQTIANGTDPDAGLYDWSSVETALQSFAKANMQSGFIGNAYANALNCIRGCHWVPFDQNTFSDGHAEQVYLGEFDTTFTMQRAETSTKSFAVDVPLSWRYSDWRRGTLEHAFIHLPFCGTIALTDDVKNSTSIKVRIGANCMDGTISYQLQDSSGALIGEYGTKISAPYAIGINQAASAGQIFQSLMQGADKMLSAATSTASAFNVLSPGSIVGVGTEAARAALTGISATYDTQNIAMTHNATCIGSFGASGVALNHINTVICFTKSTELVTSQANNAVTMGYPTMKQMSLANLTGYCQCANAHVECSGSAPEKDAIDTMLNSGIFIE